MKIGRCIGLGFLVLAAACGARENAERGAPRTEKIVPSSLSLDGFNSAAFELSPSQCEFQRVFVDWFIANYVAMASVEDPVCVVSNSGDRTLSETEFDGVTLRCKAEQECSYFTFTLRMGAHASSVLVSYVFEPLKERRYGILVTASAANFQMLFPAQAIERKYLEFTLDQAGDRNLPLMFVTYASALKVQR